MHKSWSPFRRRTLYDRDGERGQKHTKNEIRKNFFLKTSIKSIYSLSKPALTSFRTAKAGFDNYYRVFWSALNATTVWSGLRGSNPPPSPWQGDALPNELNPHWCLRSESNQRHEDFQSSALPTELQRHTARAVLNWRPEGDSNP